jgi:hypothetical protein
VPPRNPSPGVRVLAWGWAWRVAGEFQTTAIFAARPAPPQDQPLHLRGEPWARIDEFVGQRNLAVTANTYSHVMLEEGEVDYARLLATSLRK